MALQYTFTSATGITSSSAYHKIYKIEYNTKKSTATAYAEIFHNSSARTNGKIPIDVVEFEFAMSIGDKDDNPLKQAYTAIKTKTSVRDRRGRPISLDYTNKNVQDV
mgnify:CR=1 FL=1